jgi:23S rRNA (guanosine2251-2'-O)-methyltransferase
MYLYGYHACYAALLNSDRIIEKILLTDRKQLDSLPPLKKVKIEIIDRKQLENLLPVGAVHQGIALSVQPLKNKGLEFLDSLPHPNQRVIVLDQVSDPHNVGAILRSAAVFGASALVITERNAPKESGTLAKTASGALELVPLCIVKNLAQALEELKAMNFWCVGFSEKGQQTLDQIDLKGRIALVLGSEGDGMRQRTQNLCDFQVRLPSAAAFSTLNVSNAAAIALYEVFTQQQR